MNDVQSLIDRQLGLPCRYGYDSVVRRLVVRETEWWHGLGAPGADDPPIFACRFADAPGFHHILALANEDGRVAIQDISKTDSEGSMQGFQCHNNAVFDLAWMPGAMNFVTVSGDHTACLWDASAPGGPARVSVFAAHTRSVKTAAVRPAPAAPAFATGARDGAVLLWDARAPPAPAAAPLRPDNSLLGCHSNGAPRPPASHGKRARLDSPRPVSITGLVFQDENTLISCGECDGNIKVWDLRKNYSVYTREPLPKHSIPYCGSSTRNGYTNLAVDGSRVRLYASCMDHVIYCFNIATYSARPERRYRGHENATFYIKTALSPDGKYLVSGSSDKFAYIWNVWSSHPLARLAAHRAEVTCAAWARAPAPALVTGGDDARHMLWRVGGEGPDPGLCGRAEPAPRAAAAEPWPAGERRRAKRCLAEPLDAARADEPTAKKTRPEEPEPPLLAAGSKRARPPADADGPSKRSCPEGAAERRPGFVTPTKADRTSEREARRALSPRSPNTLAPPPPAPRPPAASFAERLPDYVRDGEAPHLRLMSPPPKRRSSAPDWLTLLARGKRARAEYPSPSPSPAPYLSPSPSPAPAPHSPKENAPPRRGSTSERTPKATSKNKTLLKYFSVATKQKF